MKVHIRHIRVIRGFLLSAGAFCAPTAYCSLLPPTFNLPTFNLLTSLHNLPERVLANHLPLRKLQQVNPAHLDLLT